MGNETQIAPEIREIHPTVLAHILLDRSISGRALGLTNAIQDRHLIFLDTDFDIHLTIRTGEPRRELHGQIIPRIPTGSSFAVVLRIHGKPEQTTTTDSSGEFRFLGLTAGNVAVEVEVPSRRILMVFDIS